jgi:hypothetical protein
MECGGDQFVGIAARNGRKKRQFETTQYWVAHARAVERSGASTHLGSPQARSAASTCGRYSKHPAGASKQPGRVRRARRRSELDRLLRARRPQVRFLQPVPRANRTRRGRQGSARQREVISTFASEQGRRVRRPCAFCRALFGVNRRTYASHRRFVMTVTEAAGRLFRSFPKRVDGS